jgi:hypothetical protein
MDVAVCARWLAEWVDRPASARRRSEAGIAPVVFVFAAVIGVGILTGFIWDPIKVIAQALAGVADKAVQQLPMASDLGLSTTAGWIKGYTLLNTFLPLSEALTLVSVYVSVITAGMLFRVGVIVWHLIPKPGVGT